MLTDKRKKELSDIFSQAGEEYAYIKQRLSLGAEFDSSWFSVLMYLSTDKLLKDLVKETKTLNTLNKVLAVTAGSLVLLAIAQLVVLCISIR